MAIFTILGFQCYYLNLLRYWVVLHSYELELVWCVTMRLPHGVLLFMDIVAGT